MSAERPARMVLVGPAAPWRGGIAQHTDALAAELRARGHDVLVVTFSRQYPGLFFPGAHQTEPGRTRRRGTEALVDSINPLSWRAAGRRIRAFAPRLCLVSYWLPFFAPCYAGIVGALDRTATRVVLDCHNVLPHERRPLDRALTKWALSLADRFVVHSEAVRGELHALRPGAVAIVAPLPLAASLPDGPGREAARAALGIVSDRAVLLHFGFIRPYKGLDVAMRAMAELPDDVVLVVAGEMYDRRERYDALAEALGPRLSMVDRYVPLEEVGTYFDAADLVVLPYRRATQSGVVPLAWRYGVPVVTTRTGGLAERVTDGEDGLLVPADDPSALAAAIARALEPETNRRLREGVSRARESASWAVLGGAIEGLLT